MVRVALPAIDRIVALSPIARNFPSRIATASTVLDCPSIVRILPFTSTSVGAFRSVCWAWAEAPPARHARTTRHEDRSSIQYSCSIDEQLFKLDQDEPEAAG